jgi:DNA-binding LytR/AlgR family response regulator
LKNTRTEIQPKIEEFIYLKVEFQTVRVPCCNILFIEGLKDYAKIHMTDADKSILSLITLKALEEKLPKDRFMRIHKSFIVSLDKITSVTKNSVYIGNIMIPVSDLFRDEFNKFIDTWQ